MYQLSATCRMLREISAPVLFEYCKAILRQPACEDNLFPISLKPYIKSITLEDDCPELQLANGFHPEIRYSDDPAVCGVFSSSALSRALQNMPRLRKILVLCPFGVEHSLPWASLWALATLPNISKLNVNGFLLRPPDPIWDFPRRFEPTHLNSFIISLSWDEENYPSLPQARKAFSAFMVYLAPTVERMVLANEVVFPRALLGTRWPCLKELTLHGEASAPLEMNEPYMALLRSMPQLRRLHLQLVLPPKVDNPPIIWPEGVDIELPWPDLDSLILSHPRLDDKLYQNLPSHMQRLALCCAPYYYRWSWGPPAYIWYRSLRSRTLTSFELLDILRRCRLPHLRQLVIEFIADESEMELYKYISYAFPSIEQLSINIYRVRCNPCDIPVTQIATKLSSMRCLRSLQMHLGYQPAHELANFLADDGDIETSLTGIIENAAYALLNAFAPPLDTVTLLHPSYKSPRWRSYSTISGRHSGPMCGENELSRLWLGHEGTDPFDPFKHLYRL
ncbi:hypothetical protein C8Q79DRAFT_461260 [Trametes meyenii]|nr:hypothetical protein C8Q79DRAFT_461260 [Trametes meyenii]